MPPSSMNDLFSFLTQLMTQHAALFETMGGHMFRAFAVILISWYGVKSALPAAGGGPMTSFPFERFASLLMTIAFGFGMITYYSQPLPGIGISFYHLIIDQGLYLANQLDYSMTSEVLQRITGLYWGMETPGLTITLNVLEVVRYVLTVIALVL